MGSGTGCLTVGFGFRFGVMHGHLPPTSQWSSLRSAQWISHAQFVQVSGSDPAWRTRWEVSAYDPERDELVLIVGGLVDTPAGGVQVCIRVGEGPVLILAIQDATGFAGHLNATTSARLEVTAKRLGGER